MINIEGSIEVETVVDPATIEQDTGSAFGSIYGTSSNSRFAAFNRHPNRRERIKGLYFAGGSTHPGGGIPLCMASAAIVSEMIVNQDTL
jgi:phytoene dehydrogenase-like protein